MYYMGDACSKEELKKLCPNTYVEIKATVLTMEFKKCPKCGKMYLAKLLPRKLWASKPEKHKCKKGVDNTPKE
jgi:Zn-finger nucleic acid-binding protein